ncbi:GGDEF domain-containing protein [Synechococcus sp. Nb3U1]|uniref:diguanylate cyclase n=1 Tax=Synechococcus sp. Nb3U1 TaxID=1914529 RepID=UPI001F46300B|nr:GGDEF domain-containing protein [Synechococcus sp. Nb3U1]MCF2972680.1 GGDEF domain-containing protein [Synechococcus sp. Nb3U1]
MALSVMPLDSPSPYQEEPTTQIPKEASAQGSRGKSAEAFLTVLSGANTGMTLPLQDGLFLGRSGNVDIQLTDHGISRQHCRLDVENGRYILTDLKSLNGTYVNGERITRIPLLEGDRIQIGASTLKFAYYDWVEEAFFLQMASAAIYDPLTGLHNRRFFMEQLELEIQFALRHQTSLYVLYFDLDGFKLVNDQWGHLAGDQALIQAAHQLQAQVRKEDLLARLGGDEFALMVRGIEESQVLQLAERFRCAIESLSLEIGKIGSELVSFTCSIGIAAMGNLQGEVNRQKLLAAADHALYQAKARGRNRVVLL